MTFLRYGTLVTLASVALGTVQVHAAGGAKAHPGKASGREAVASVRHDWKKNVQKMGAAARSLPIPKNFGSLTPEQRLAYLHNRRNLAPRRFDHYHPYLGALLARDDRLRAAMGTDCRPLNGLLPDNSRTRYLEMRRNLNPTRFDHYHPALGAILAENDKLKQGTGCVAAELIPPPSQVLPPPGTPAPGPPVGGGILPTRSIPEPGSMALVALGAAVLVGPAVWRRRHSAESAEIEA